MLCSDFLTLAELLRRPPINRISKLIENVIETNNTENLRSYIEAGCINTHDAVQSTKKCMFNFKKDSFLLIQCLFW